MAESMYVDDPFIVPFVALFEMLEVVIFLFCCSFFLHAFYTILRCVLEFNTEIICTKKDNSECF